MQKVSLYRLHNIGCESIYHVKQVFPAIIYHCATFAEMVDETLVEEGDSGGGILSRDRAEHRRLLREVVGIAGEAEATMTKLVAKLEDDPGRLAQGIDFLDIKNGLLAEYNANLAFLVMRKTRGELIEGDKAVERLCYLRTMMEKIRPIEHKLKFQIDKYVNLAETGQVR